MEFSKNSLIWMTSQNRGFSYGNIFDLLEIVICLIKTVIQKIVLKTDHEGSYKSGHHRSAVPFLHKHVLNQNISKDKGYT